MKIPQELQQAVSSLVINEYEIARQNQSSRRQAFDAIRDMFYAERTEKEYDWQSDIFIPKMAQHVWSSVAKLVKMYFSARERVRALPVGRHDKDKARAASKLLNRLLTRPGLKFFVKFVRAITLATLYGDATIKGWWTQELKEKIVGSQKRLSPELGEYGQIIGAGFIEDEIKEEMPVKDFFDCQVYESRNVFYSPEITDSPQDKRYVIFRSVEDIISLKKQEQMFNYFNLDKLIPDEQPATNIETNNIKLTSSALFKDIEILERWGLFPVRTTPAGTALPALDENGKPMDNADWQQIVLTIANINTKQILIRFEKNTYEMIPAARLFCYIDPHKDEGIGQGTYVRDLQIAINDNFNMRNDSVILNTIGMNIVKKDAAIEWDTIVVAPNNNMLVEDPQSDIVPWRPGVNVTDAAMQHQILDNELSRTTAEYPHSMGDFPGRREPATTAMMAQETGNYRNNLVAMTLEYTGLTDLYNMILKMADKFMHPQTGLDILEDDARFLELSGDWDYRPVSVSIEPESQKMLKVQMLQNLIPTLVNIPNPNTVKIINKIMGDIFTTLGDEFEDYAGMLLDENTPINTGKEDVATLLQQAAGGIPTSNEQGMPQTPTEQAARQMGTMAGGGQI